MNARAHGIVWLVYLLSLAWIAPATAGSPARVEYGFSAGPPPNGVPRAESPPVAALAVCHDGIWEDAEFCGRDAYLNTSAAELNHDCYSDALDFSLFARQWMLSGPGMSADLDGDGAVFIMDLSIFRLGVFHRACPGTPSGMQPDECQGTVALSFSDDPDLIVQQLSVPPGQLTSLYVVVDDYTQAAFIEVAIRASDNIEILDHQLMPIAGQITGWGIFDLPPQLSYRAQTPAGEGLFPDPPRIFSEITFRALDSEPAWIKLEGFPAVPGALPARLRWAERSADHSVDFATVLNAGINGPPPPGVSTCGTPMDDPCGGVDPICDAGGPYGGVIGRPLDLDGTASFDPDPGGTVVAYFWDFGDGWYGAGPNVSHVYAAPGVYGVTLTVTDASGRFGACQTTADIAVENAAPVCHAGGPYAGNAGEAVSFDGTGSHDPDGTIVEYEWDFGDGSTGTGPTPSHAYASPGNFTVELCVADNRGGSACCTTTVDVSEPAAVSGEPVAPLPERVTLGPIRPNPFNPSTLIRYELPAAGRVVMQIFDVRGRAVRVLVDEMRDTGYHAVTWDGRDGSGRAMRSGVYICRLDVGGRRISEKMVLAR